MPRSSSLTQEQRQTAVTFFEAGVGREAVATQLGVRPSTLRSLYDRWRVWGPAVLHPTAVHPGYAVALKVAVVQRALAGESKVALAQEYGVSSLSLIDAWVRTYRRDGSDGLQAKPRGRPPQDESTTAPETELQRLQRENERLRAEVAYLGKLRALRANERR